MPVFPDTPRKGPPIMGLLDPRVLAAKKAVAKLPPMKKSKYKKPPKA